MGKADRIHDVFSTKRAEALVPLQARLKSSGLRIGQLAAMTGLRTSAIRYYEEVGLMPHPGRRSGQRVYGLAEVRRLRMIVTARSLGFGISELKHMSGADRESFRTAALVRAGVVRQSLAQLEASAALLERLADCDCGPHQKCALEGGS